MHYLATLNDNDIFSQSAYNIPGCYEKRVTVKAVVINKIGQYGFVTNPVHGFYLLAGGGVESGDLAQEIKRECIEEIGYEVEVVREIGRVQEYRNRDAKEYETVCFLVKTKKRIYEDLRTENEKMNGLSVVWFDGEEAQKILKRQVIEVGKGEVGFYNTAFNIIRDQLFFEEVFKQKNDQ